MKYLIIDGIRVDFDYTYESFGFKLKVLILCKTNDNEVIKSILQREKTLLKFLNLHHIKTIIKKDADTWEVMFNTRIDKEYKPKSSYV